MNHIKSTIAALGLCASLAACGGATPTPVVNAADVARIQGRLVQACLASGLFKLVNGAVVMAVPPAALPANLANAEIDRVCADPALAARNIAQAEAVIAALQAAAQRSAR